MQIEQMKKELSNEMKRIERIISFEYNKPNLIVRKLIPKIGGMK